MNKLDVLAYINPQMRAVLEKEQQLAGDANDTSAGFEQMRINYAMGRKYWNQQAPRMLKVVNDQVMGEYGKIPVRYYYPTDKENSPAIIYIHGGGFVVGNTDTHDRITRLLAQKTGAIVVSVDYSLSPEAKFPVAVQEVATVAHYLHQHAAKYHLDGNKLAFAGDSGGAHLSLAATLYLRQEMGDSSFIRCLLLYYGWFGLVDSSSMRLFGGWWDGLTEEDWKYYKSLYVNDETEIKTSPYANLFLNDLSQGIPPCYIAAAQYDPLLDDSNTLAAILKEYALPYKYEVFNGVIHGFLHYSLMLDEANDALQHGASFYRQQIGL